MIIKNLIRRINMEEKSMIHSKENIIKMCIWIFVIICIVFLCASYLINDEFRNKIDTKILKKEIAENSANMIEINSDSNPYVNSFDKYIVVLSKNVLNFYNQEATNIAKIDVTITTPYMASNGKYLAIAEDGGQKIYLISELGVKWESDISGEIYRVNVNKNGYVSVLFKNTTHSSIIVLYDANGKELFKYYFKESHAICAEASENNQYLAIGKIDYSGTVVKSIVEIISIDSALEDPKHCSLYAYESESGKILNNIKFNSKHEAICRFASYVQKVTSSSDERLYDVKKGDAFVDINLEDHFVVVEKENSGLFSYQYQINIKSTTGKSDKLYILENGAPKSLQLNKNLICAKLVGEVRVIRSNGWLIKKYKTGSEIQDIVLGDSIMGIVYNNKIEVINL